MSLTTAEKGLETVTRQVFISYSYENETDRKVADTIYDTLKAREISCWMAHRDIDAGQNWPDEISKAISNSQVMIVVLSEYTQHSHYVKREVMQAADENLTIIPFCIEKVSLSGGLKLLLSDCHWINAYPRLQDKNLDRLVMTLHKRLGIEPGLGKQLEVVYKSPVKKVVHNAKKSPRLKRVLGAVSIIIAIIAAVFFINQWTHNPETTPVKNITVEPDFISDLKSKGWDVKKNESDCWEAFYKIYGLTMIYIPPGKFIMGSNDGYDENPPHEVDLDGYWIGKYEVTFAQYDRYCEKTGKKKPDDLGWGRENRPVIHVPWDGALAYCKWLSQETGLTFQLPTEAQWEKAAIGTKGFIYPWGNDFDKSKCNSVESGLQKTMPVGAYPSGKSPYGCMDMAGNVWEWCADWYDWDYYKNSPAKNPQGPSTGTFRALRGGSWGSLSSFQSCLARFFINPRFLWSNVGFRVVCEFKDEKRLYEKRL